MTYNETVYIINKGVFMKILAIGEIIFDIFNGEAEIGGAPLNFCAHCSLIGEESALISATGRDNLAEAAINHLNVKQFRD